MANKNEQIAEKVLEAVGGKVNIVSVAHCMTRLRFNLKDINLPNQEEIKSIDGVLSVVISGGQFQVVIGQNVPKVYEAICNMAGIKALDQINENPDDHTGKLTPKQVGLNILNYVTASITPLIPIIMAAAMIKTISTIFGSGMLGLIAEGSNLAILLDFVYDAGFYFFPLYIGYTAAKRLNTSIPLAMFLGGILIAPGFMELIHSETAFSVYGIPCAVNNYSSTLIPILMIVWIMNYLYKFFNKHIPAVLSTIFTPFLTIVVMLPIALCVLAPLGNYIGEYLATFLNWFGSVGGGFAVGIVGASFCFLVMTGMHGPLATMAVATLFSTGSDSLVFVGASCSMAACAGMALGTFLRLKNKEEKALCLGYLTALLASGITEPSIYGIGVRYKKPFIALGIGGLAGGLYAGFTNVTYHALIAPLVLYPFAYSAGGTANMINGTISCVISIIVGTVVTYFFCFNKTNSGANN